MSFICMPSRKLRLLVGERMKGRRKALKLTLQEVAKRSGLSAPFISQAERDATVPSLVSLLALAKALEVDVSYFMQVTEAKDVVHRGARPNRVRVDSPVEYIDLTSVVSDRRLDIILMRIPPGHVFPVDQRKGEDFLYLLTGEIYATAGRTEACLQAGDSMHFDSRLPHTARNQSSSDAVLLYVGTPGVFANAAARPGDIGRPSSKS